MQAWGSEGDIRPFLALAAALRRAGHDPSLVVTDLDDRRYDAVAAALDVPIRTVATPVASPEALSEIGQRLLKARNAFEQGKLIRRRLFEPALDEMAAASHALCRDSDVVVGHFFLHPLRSIAKAEGVPEVSVTLSGDMIPSASYPPTGLPALGVWGNRFWWWLARQALRMEFLPPVNVHRARLGLRPLTSMTDAWHSRLLDLVAVSPSLVPPAADWDPRHRVTGFFSLPEAADVEALPEPVERFLDAGPPPVFMGFGSLAPPTPAGRRETAGILIAAARRAGVRAILQNLDAEDAQGADDILHVGRVAHTRLFPRCAAVVHHGGAGTTQTTVHAGVPSVVVPHISDQFAWGALLQRAGVGARPLPRTRLRPDPLAARIRWVLGADMHQRARQLATAVAAEDGPTTAVRLLEGVVAPHGRSTSP